MFYLQAFYDEIHVRVRMRKPIVKAQYTIVFSVYKAQCVI